MLMAILAWRLLWDSKGRSTFYSTSNGCHTGHWLSSNNVLLATATTTIDWVLIKDPILSTLQELNHLIPTITLRGRFCHYSYCSVMSDSLQSCGLWPTRLLCPWDFSRQEHWRGLPFSPSEDLPDPGIEPTSPVSPALAGRLPLSHLGSPWNSIHNIHKVIKTQSSQALQVLCLFLFCISSWF